MHSHTHDHDHPHSGHAHDHTHESYSARPHPGHVLLDLGDGIGALIVHTDAELVGIEVEISPAGNDGLRQHKEVLQRVANGHSTHVLVFDNLSEGDYTLWIDDVAWARNVRVTGGEIAELDQRRAGLPVLAAAS